MRQQVQLLIKGNYNKILESDWSSAALICNSNWTEWSTIHWVIARGISKWDEREARGRFEIANTSTPWIVRQEMQLLINRIYKRNLELEMSEAIK